MAIHDAAKDADLDAAYRAAMPDCGAVAGKKTTAQELSASLRDLRVWLVEIETAIAASKTPEVSDARLLKSYAADVERLVIKATVDKLSAQAERTPEQDRASQIFVETKGKY
jgi:hypothetical protein